MTSDLLEQAMQEIAEDDSLTAAQKLKKQAEVKRHYRSITGKSEMVIGRKDKTSIVGTFFRSMARTAGRSFIKSIFK